MAARELIPGWVRVLVITRDRRRCRYCGAVPVGRRRRQLDHVRPVFRGGQSEPSNPVVACSTCNSAKSSRLDVVPMPLTQLVDIDEGRAPERPPLHRTKGTKDPARATLVCFCCDRDRATRTRPRRRRSTTAAIASTDSQHAEAPARSCSSPDEVLAAQTRQVAGPEPPPRFGLSSGHRPEDGGERCGTSGRSLELEIERPGCGDGGEDGPSHQQT